MQLITLDFKPVWGQEVRPTGLSINTSHLDTAVPGCGVRDGTVSELVTFSYLRFTHFCKEPNRLRPKASGSLPMVVDRTYC